ncbi:YtxH domain-containing protein [Companilactobacillus hulinensis]|uniref:YtxH domain-containing protein n=1 Tax=Companilactobacillus hulinensis TaxID=2486007 RepID=UPI00177F07DA|nr:YtxH domain-containing protein [Companilactobacillus hulinensis]
MKNNQFLLGLVLGSAAGYAASKYLTSESGQRMLENVKTIRGDFNNGGVGFAGKDDLVNNFNEKTGVLKEQMHATADKIREDEDASNIIFNEDDLESTDNKKAVDDLNNDTDATSGASENFDEDDAK